MEGHRKKKLILQRSGKDEFAIEYQTVQEFLELKHIKQIPAYQRPYSWEVSHVERLLDDISNSSQNEKEWFLGPVFTSYNLDKDNIRELLDGQQRMTTLILTLRCLYCSNYIVSDEQWNNPIFTLPDDCEDEEKELTRLRKEYLDGFSHTKRMIQELLLIEERQGAGKAPVYISKFHTAESTKESLNTYLLQIMSIDSREEYSSSSYVPITDNEDFAPTLISLNRNIDAINKHIKGILLENNKVRKNGLDRLNRFINALLSLTFIEIPLDKSEDVVDIFESINNRGKRLTLSDIIRFRSIKEYSGDKERQEKLAVLWNEIFRYASKLSKGVNSKKYFSNLDVFFERYINSISQTNAGYTENGDRIERFCGYYNSNGRNLEGGIEEVLLTLKKWDFIVNGGFENHSLWKKYQDNVSTLTYLVKSMLVYSENFQITFIAFLRNQVPSDYSQDVISGIPYQMTELLKTSFCISVFHRIQSNDARGKYILIARSFDAELMQNANKKVKYPPGPYTYSKFKEKYTTEQGEEVNVIDVPELKKSEKNLTNILWVKRGEKDTAELILGMYQMFDKKTIPDYSSYKWNHLDHIMPEKWFKNQGWKEQNSEIDLIDAITDIQDADMRDAFENLQRREDFYAENKWASTFIQLIGNKIHLGAAINRSKSNSFWHPHPENDSKSPEGVKLHLERYFSKDPNSAFIVPYGPEKPYNMEEFTIHSIIERTEKIATKIVDDFSSFRLRCQ